MLAQLTSADFKEHLNSKFEIVANERIMISELVDVSDIETAASSEMRRAFSLIFQVTKEEAILPQGVYQLNHDTMPEISIRLVPVGIINKQSL